MSTDDPEDGDRESTGGDKQARADKFHEASGDFAEVGKAVAALVVLAIIAYVVFVLL